MTSSAVRLLPLWKVTPLRILKTHFLAPSEGSMLSTTSGVILPLASTSVRPLDMAPQNGTWVAVSGYPAGSPVSVVAPWARPNLAEPPFFGVAATPASLSIVVASAVPTPRAAARPMNSRRLIRPLTICCVQYSSSLIGSLPVASFRAKRQASLWVPRHSGFPGPWISVFHPLERLSPSRHSLPSCQNLTQSLAEASRNAHLPRRFRMGRGQTSLPEKQAGQ